MTALGKTDAGEAALASNFTVIGDIQSGAAKQPLLLFIPDQQQQSPSFNQLVGVEPTFTQLPRWSDFDRMRNCVTPLSARQIRRTQPENL